jgi:hypothetical protein
VVVIGVVGIVALVVLLRRRAPGNAAELASFTGWVMLVAILVAPATRVGYLLYPINLFVWAWMFRRSEDPAGAGAGHWSSGSSKTSRENLVVPAEVVGETTTPASQ